METDFQVLGPQTIALHYVPLPTTATTMALLPTSHGFRHFGWNRADRNYQGAAWVTNVLLSAAVRFKTIKLFLDFLWHSILVFYFDQTVAILYYLKHR